MSRAMNVKQWMGTVTGPFAVGDEPEITISSDLPDRTGDRVLPSGADVANFMANPTLTWAHSRDEIPIGTITHLEIGPRSRMRWRWLEGDPFAARVRNAWEQGIIRAASIEFLPKAGGTQANAHGGYDYTAWELLAVSLVPLPANAQAVKNLGLLVDVPAYREWLGISAPDTRSSREKDFDIMMGVRGLLIARARNYPAHGEAMPWPAPRNLDEVLPECRSFQPLGPARSHSVNLVGQGAVEITSSDLGEVLRHIARKLGQELRPMVDAEVARALNRLHGRK